jgi:hypothetical protein
MKSKREKVLIALSVLGTLIFLYFTFAKHERRFLWHESYRADSDQPYGALFIRKMLESYRTGNTFKVSDKPLKHSLGDIENPANTDYVFIGHNMFLDKGSIAALVKFMEKGGDVFIASRTPPSGILNAVYFKECGDSIQYEQNHTTSLNLNFFHDSLHVDNGFSYAFRYGTEDRSYPWSHVGEKVFCDSTRSIVPLGYQEDYFVNYIKVPAGKGNLYLHSNPLVFTNYFLRQPEKVLYASSVFSHLDGKDILWDEHSKIFVFGNSNPYNSPLYYILQQPNLKYAWWLLLLTTGLYIIFQAKRRQRIIPVLEPKSNTSLEFVNLIARLHYKNGNHVDMARKKMKYFLYFVRSRYGMHAETFGDEQIRRLAEKSKVRVGDVQVIFSQYYLIEERFRHSIEAGRLVDLYEAIENFYKQCK